MAKISRTQWVKFDERPSQFSDEKNDCAVRAFAALGVSYKEAHARMAELGRKRGKGINTYRLVELMDSKDVLGLRFETIPEIHCNSRVTLGRFLNEHPVGRYFCHKASHVFAVVDGKVLDSWRMGNRCLVDRVWRVLQGSALGQPGEELLTYENRHIRNHKSKRPRWRAREIRRRITVDLVDCLGGNRTPRTVTELTLFLTSKKLDSWDEIWKDVNYIVKNDWCMFREVRSGTHRKKYVLR